MQKHLKMKKVIFAAMCLVLAACSSHHQSELPYYSTPDFMPHWLPDDQLGGVHIIPAFNLTDQEGQPVNLHTVKGKIYTANFFFTSCGSVCPRMMDNLEKVQQAFVNDKHVLILSHTVMPERDSVAVLKRYAIQHHINHHNWLLLTGDKDTIYHLARQAYFADEAQGFYKGTNDFLHTENIVLVDADGHIRGVYNGMLALETEHLIAHIKILEREMLAAR